jgi:predicted ester cyclase
VTDTEWNKALVRRLVDEVVNQDRPEVLDDVACGDVARAAREWIGPFRRSFPDFSMEIVELIAEGDKVVGRFTCSGTHAGEWLGHAPTGRRFLAVDEIYIFSVTNRKLSGAVAVEDNLARLQQLGLLTPFEDPRAK